MRSRLEKKLFNSIITMTKIEIIKSDEPFFKFKFLYELKNI